MSQRCNMAEGNADSKRKRTETIEKNHEKRVKGEAAGNTATPASSGNHGIKNTQSSHCCNNLDCQDAEWPKMTMESMSMEQRKAFARVLLDESNQGRGNKTTVDAATSSPVAAKDDPVTCDAKLIVNDCVAKLANCFMYPTKNVSACTEESMRNNRVVYNCHFATHVLNNFIKNMSEKHPDAMDYKDDGFREKAWSGKDGKLAIGKWATRHLRDHRNALSVRVRETLGEQGVVANMRQRLSCPCCPDTLLLAVVFNKCTG